MNRCLARFPRLGLLQRVRLGSLESRHGIDAVLVGSKETLRALSQLAPLWSCDHLGWLAVGRWGIFASTGLWFW